jgi:hypothetical protein
VLNCLSLLIAHSVPSFLSFHPIPLFTLLVLTSKSRRLHFSFICTLSSQVLRNLLCTLILPVVSEFLILSLLSCLYVSLFLSLSSFLLLLVFPLLNWHTRFSDSISLFPSYPCFFFFSFQHSVSILHSSPPAILSSNFAAVFPAFTLNLFLFPAYVTWRFSVHS